MAPEPFVSAQEAAKFIGISRRFLIELARRGIIGASDRDWRVAQNMGLPSFGTRRRYRSGERWDSPMVARKRAGVSSIN